MSEYKENAIDFAMKYAAKKERCKKEVELHLSQKGFGEEAIDHAIQYLVDERFIDEERYCDYFISCSLEKRKGRKFLAQQLLSKGLSEKNIWKAMDRHLSQEQEEDNLHYWISKLFDFENNNVIDDKDISRIYRKLITYGFDNDNIYSELMKKAGESL